MADADSIRRVFALTLDHKDSVQLAIAKASAIIDAVGAADTDVINDGDSIRIACWAAIDILKGIDGLMNSLERVEVDGGAA